MSRAFKYTNISSVQLILGRLDEAKKNIYEAINWFSKGSDEQNKVNIVICYFKLIEILLRKKTKVI